MKLICVDARCPDFDRLGIKIGSIVDGEPRGDGWLVRNMWFFQSRFKVWPEPARLDLNKPVQTKDGRPVRILCTDAAGAFCVVGLLNGYVQHWRADGSVLEENKCLMNVPTKPPQAAADLVLYRSKKHGVRILVDGVGTIKPENILGRKTITITEGEGM